MTDEQFAGAVHAVSLSLSMMIERRGIPKADTTKVLTATLAQSLAQAIGPVATIDRLRDYADLMERQVWAESGQKH